MPTKTKAVPQVTGYRTEESLFATRYKQGGRTVFSLALSPDQIVNLIGRPDPDAPNPGNRRIRPAHAQGFAKYFREHDEWVIPGIILRAPNIFDFTAVEGVSDPDVGADFGVITYPKRAQTDIQILDGQHRILGFHMAAQGIEIDLEKARSQRAAAKRQDPDGAGVAEADRRIKELNIQRDRLYSERISVEIQITDDAIAYKQMFFDIAENALGITASVKARFDNRKVVNRALPEVMEHPLLLNRVDLEADRLGRGSPFLLGAKHVAEVTRAANVGIDGRVGRRQEAEWKEKEVARRALDFLDAATNSFASLQAVKQGQIMPDDLRKTSLLGSVLMFRVLAGAYWSLIEEHSFSKKMVAEFFEKLSPHMVGPVHRNSIWLQHTSEGTFYDGFMAPSGRRQEIKRLAETVTGWAIDKPKWLDAAPLPAPEPEKEPLPEVENDEAWALLEKTTNKLVNEPKKTPAANKK